MLDLVLIITDSWVKRWRVGCAGRGGIITANVHTLVLWELLWKTTPLVLCSQGNLRVHFRLHSLGGIKFMSGIITAHITPTGMSVNWWTGSEALMFWWQIIKCHEINNRCASVFGDHECLHKISWQSIPKLLRCGPTDRPAYVEEKHIDGWNSRPMRF